MDPIGTPYREAHALLTSPAAQLLAGKDFDVEQHKALWEEFYPPSTPAAREVLDITCRGRAVPQEVIEKARRENG